MAATKLGQLGQELSRQNPWWRTQDWARFDPDLRKAAEHHLGYRSNCLARLEEGSLYILRGPRRVGKTVAVKQVIEHLLSGGVPPHAVVRVAADGWSAADLRTVAGNVALPPVPEGVRRWWFVDEVTGVAGDWAAQIKWLRDNDPEFAEATVVLTGSSAEELASATGVLAGRRGSGSGLDRTVLPVGFRTFARLVFGDVPDADRLELSDLRERDAYAQLLPWLDVLVRGWELYLSYGGFPVAVAAARAGTPIPEWFIEDMFNVVFRDTFATSRLSITTTMALLARIGEGMGAPANLNAIARDVGVSQDVVTRHVGYLRNAYLLWDCPRKADRTWTARLRAQDKLYAVDPLVARLPHLRNAAQPDLDPTSLAEMQIGMCLQRAACAAGVRWGDDHFLFYVRTPSRKEIDFVGEPLAGVALEGKYTEGGRWKGDAATVEASEWDGILLTRNVLDAAGSGAWAVPAGLFAYLVDT
ncbi:MAG: AAA family ATPase [Acidimicrobiales bacterium]